MALDIVKIIETTDPLPSPGGTNHVIEVPNTELALKYTMEKQYGNHGIDMFCRHLRVYLLDEYFVKINKYERNHVPRPVNHFEYDEGDKFYTGYTYIFTESKGGTSNINELLEWGIFDGSMEKAGFYLSSRKFDEGGWAGQKAETEHIVYFGGREEKSLNWVVISLGNGKFTRLDRIGFENFIRDNEESLKKELGPDKFKLLKNPESYPTF